MKRIFLASEILYYAIHKQPWYSSMTPALFEPYILFINAIETLFRKNIKLF